MDILKELKKAWDNAVLTKSEKQAASADSLEQLKREIESASGTSVEKPVLPDAPTYEKIDYTAKTDEQLEQNAANAYKEYERKALENIEQSINAEREDLNKNKTDAQNAKDAKLEKIDELYDTAKKSLNDDVLKRGLARSSIAVAQSAGLEKSRADGKTEAENAFEKTAEEIARRILGLDEKKRGETAKLDKELADKVAAKLEELKDKEREIALDALKYNNSIEEKTAKDKADRLKLEQTLYGQALDNAAKEKELSGSESATANMYASNYNKMDGLLGQMNRSDAARILKDDPFFRANLSDYLYYKLYTKYAG